MSLEAGRVRLLVVGLGKLGLLHAGLARSLPHCELVAVVEPSATLRKIFTSQVAAIDAYPDVESVPADARIDGVIIATPTASHPGLVEWAMGRRLAVLVEKPLAATASDSARLMRSPDIRAARIAVGYMTRFTETFAHARILMSQGVIGDVLVVRASMYVEQLMTRGRGWRYDASVAGGGVLITQNSHLLDLLIWLVGPIRCVSGHTGRLVSDGVEDLAHAWLDFEGGAVGFLDSSWTARHYRTASIQIYCQGTNGTIEVTDDDVRLFLDHNHGGHTAGWSTWSRVDLFTPVPVDIGGPAYTRQMMAFCDLARGTADTACSVEDAHRVQCTIDAIYESARSGGAPREVRILQ